MSTQISKRELFSKHALSAGLGVGALTLLPQRASADAPFTSFAFTATGAPTPRTMPDRLSEIKNVKDYGAVGNGVTDDTAAIQACFDAAFGTWDSPHGGTPDVGPNQNSPVFFPRGIYLVASKFAARSITGCANDGTGKIRLTVSTTGLVNGDMVYVRGVTGTTFANYSYSIADVDATHLTLRNSQFNADWTGGGTICPPALRIRSLQGGHIFGAGRLASIIHSATNNAAVISTNGFAYTKVENMSFSGSLGGIAFDLNCDGTGTVNLQSNSFDNVNFGGTASTGVDYGCTVGMGMSMGSENTFLNCYFAGGDIAALYFHNYNSLANTVIGGNIASAKIGIWNHAGACPLIHSVSFQNYQVAGQIADIYIENGAWDSYHIAACRTESANFLKTGAAQTFAVDACSQTNPGAPGFFFSGAGYVTLTNCQSVEGYIEGNPHLIINNCKFSRSDYLTAGTENFEYLQINPMPITEQRDASYTIKSADGGTKIQFNRAAAQTVSLLKNSDHSCRLGAGTKIEVQQTGTGQTRFQAAPGVTIRSANGLKLRAQYSCAVLTCDGADTWTLTGDTAV